MSRAPAGARRPLRAVVTAGGTEEAIDDVRVLGNVSSGRFGASIARSLARHGVATTVIGSRRLATTDEGLAAAAEVVPFRGIADLALALEALASDPPDLLFMAAAVSDYAPARTAGKLPSNEDELVLRFTRNPKLLAGLRASLGPGTVLIGFKLLSGVSAEELCRVALAQLNGAALDLTVANDLAELSGDRHPVWLVPGEGDAKRIDGHRDDVADRLVEAAIAIADARGDAAVRERPPGDEGGPGVLPAHGDTLTALTWACDRLGFALDARAIRVRTTHESALLIDAVEGIEAVLMVDDALGRFDAHLRCEDATSDEAVRGALAEAARAGRWAGGSFAVAIEGGGAVFGLDARAPTRLVATFEAALAEARASWTAAPDDLEERARPLFLGAQVAGIAIEVTPGLIAPFVATRSRGRGVGDAVAVALALRGARLACVEADTPFYFQRGFSRVIEPEIDAVASSGLVALAPPDPGRAVAAASVALVDPLRKRVLIGRRRVAPWEGWWAFPGGKLEPGEKPAHAGLRELAEETGVLLLPELAPALTTAVFASDGTKVYRIENLAYLVLHAEAPRRSEELEAEWVSLPAARQLRPMAAGTRRVLGRIEALLARGATR